MTETALVALGAAAVAGILDWIAVARGRRRLEYLCKPLTVAFLIAAALVLEPADAAQRVWFVGALAGSLAGDVFLMLPSAKGDTREPDASSTAVPMAFVGGLVAFLLAHLAYVIGFVVAGVEGTGLAVGAAIVVLAGATVGRTILRGAAAGGDRLITGALAAYLVVIGAMVVTAFGSGLAIAAVGALLFFGSDALIGWTRFVRALAWAPVAIIVSYHLGQAGLVLSLLG